MMSERMFQAPLYIQVRWQAVRAAMKERNITGLLVSYFPDVSYLTGFEGDDSWALLTPDRVWLVSDSRYKQQIERECPWVRTVIRRKGLAEEIIRLARRAGIRTLGVQAESLTLRQHQAIAKLTRAPRLRLRPVEDMIVGFRNIKDEHEIGLIEQALAIAERSFEALKARLRVGMTENDMAGLLVYEMRRRGAANAAFDPIVAAGSNGSLPHYRPDSVKLQNNASVLVDWGAQFKGYRCDLTRMIFIGRVPGKIMEIYQVVLAAQMAAIAAIRPGRTGRQIDQIARSIIAKAGYAKAFEHSLGHGIGRDIHEQLSLSSRSKVILQPGMVLTVEPGIYLPGLGGVRIEDDVLVTPTGHRVLSHLPKDLDSARI
jgi:Xaa-Pro aminopeptidase